MKPPRTELGRTALRPASALWKLVADARNALYDRRWARVHRLPVPVVSVGNITTGGTGKTPLVIHLARLLMRSGAAPLVLSRGYESKGTGTRTLSDGRTENAWTYFYNAPLGSSPRIDSGDYLDYLRVKR